MPSLKTSARKIASDVLHVIYPSSCLLCDTEIEHQPLSICPICQHELPLTHFQNYSEPTDLDKLFWGRVQLTATYAHLYYEEQSRLDRVLHTFKYKDRPDLAVALGKEIGRAVVGIEDLQDLDALIPIPLHPKKLFLRGYNQAERLATGIGEKINKPVDNQLLSRIAFTESQTKRDKQSRWENMQNKFRAQVAPTQYRHVAIVDDVVTTGSTIESCVRSLRAAFPDLKISVIVLAIAR